MLVISLSISFLGCKKELSVYSDVLDNKMYTQYLEILVLNKNFPLSFWRIKPLFNIDIISINIYYNFKTTWKHFRSEVEKNHGL